MAQATLWMDVIRTRAYKLGVPAREFDLFSAWLAKRLGWRCSDKLEESRALGSLEALVVEYRAWRLDEGASRLPLRCRLPKRKVKARRKSR